jgi:hypothetical protein
MLTFFITTEERRRAQERAAELDISRSNPPGRPPYVWDNRMGAVNRWYDYGSPEDKVGTVYFEPVVGADGRLLVRCTTEITHHPLRPDRQPQAETTIDPKEHDKLVEYFRRELLNDPA